MKKVKRDKEEEQYQSDFFDFITSKQVMPSASLDAKVISMIENSLAPSRRYVFAKLTLVEAILGITTLYFCPQFGLSINGNNDFFHNLHTQINFYSFYIICGLLFVSLGSAVSALLLTKEEKSQIKKSKYLYYIFFAVTAYLVFYLLASEALLTAALPWILGAILGNILIFGLVSEIKKYTYTNFNHG